MTIWSGEIKELENLYDSFKGQLPGIVKELEQLIKTQDANVVMLYSRRCLEVIVTDLCESELNRPRKTEPLKGIIDKLNSEEKVPSNIITSMHGLNSMSTYGTHPKDFDPEQVKPVLNNLSIVIKWYLKYKDFKIISKTKGEGENPESRPPEAHPGAIHKPWLKQLLLFSGILVATVIVVIALFNKAGSKKQVIAQAGVEKSIAVLPINNFTGNPDLEPLAAGIHDALISQLGQISSLLVKSRTSTLQFKDSKASIQEIAKELGANYIVESSIVGSEDSLRIIVQLIEAFPVEKHIWASNFDQKRNNIMSVYNDIIHKIASGIEITVTPYEEKLLGNNKNHNPDLLKAYYKGNYFMNQLTPEGFKQGLKYFDEAIAIDPSDPLPYLGLALGYSNAGHVSDVASDASDRALAYAHKALALDSTLTEAYVVLIARSLYTDWDFASTESYLKHAMELNPNIPMVHYHNGWFLMLKNDLEGAISEFKRSIEIDPIDPAYTCNLAAFYMWIGRYDEALAEARKTLELNPDFGYGMFVMGSAYAGLGMYNEAIETHKKGISIGPGWEGGLGVAYALAGQKEKALEVAVELEKINDKWYTWGIAEIYAALGDNDKAIYWIEQAYERRHDFIPWFKYDVCFKQLFDDPRFKEIINRLDFPE